MMKRKTKDKIIFAAYWTTMETDGRNLSVRFRFPMSFGMLRAADWAEREIEAAADRCAAAPDCADADVGERLRFMMPLRRGGRKVIHGVRSMVLSVGDGSLQIETTLRVKGSRADMADRMDDDVTRMVAWMREKAPYISMV